MIDVVLVGTVQNIAYAKLGRIFPIRDIQVDRVMVRILLTVIMTITGETDIVEIGIVEVRPLIIGVEMKEMTIIEITLVKEIGVIMITTTGAVQEVVAEVEKGDERVDAIVRRDLVGIDLAIGTKRLEIDREIDTEIDLDLEKGLVIDLGTGLEIGIVVGLAIDLAIEKDLGIEEKGTVKIIGHVDAVAKVLTMGIMGAQMKGENLTVALAQKTMCLTKEPTSLEDAGAAVEVENEVEKAGEGNVAHEAEVDLQAKEVFRISNLFLFLVSCHD